MIAIPTNQPTDRQREILEQVVKKMDFDFSYLACSCRNELEFCLLQLQSNSKMETVRDPDAYLYRCLTNAAKKYFKTIGKPRIHERNDMPLEEIASSKSLNSDILKNDVSTFSNGFSLREQHVVHRMLMYGEPAANVARDFGVSKTTIYKDKQKIIESGREILKAYRYDRD